MTDRFVALATAALAVALVAAQIVVPTWGFIHGEPYALALAVAAWVLVSYALRAGRGDDGPIGRRLAIATAGAALIVITGIASGPLGPDVQSIARAPGSVLPLPEANAAAFFPLVDADGIARGDATVILRRQNHASVEIAPGQRRVAGTAVVVAQPHVAAYVEAYDAKGRRLTVTQPINPAFLSPVLQFGTTVAIEGRSLPSDEFAVPALHRRVGAVYIDATSAAAMHATRLGDQPVVLFSVRDDAGRGVPNGIGFARSGGTADVGGLRLRLTIGTYPQIVVGSAPLPLALWLGGAAMLVGVALAIVPRAPVPVLVAGRRSEA